MNIVPWRCPFLWPNCLKGLLNFMILPLTNLLGVASIPNKGKLIRDRFNSRKSKAD